jgi:CheY-like chemotaxis protein
MSLEPPKIALIVDDSRTAREVLAKMLVKHGIRAETVESGELALDYLIKARPDVIFMDHMMPGMDGLQAVEAIKKNPATATIPIMMYTSQAGELYVGQARALGAVGVLPKQVKPVQLSEMLESLHLIPSTAENAPEMVEPKPAPAADPPHLNIDSVTGAADWVEMHYWLEQMLDQHGRTLRADIEAGVARILQDVLPAQPAKSSAFFIPEATTGDRLRKGLFLVATASIMLATVFWLYLDRQQMWNLMHEQNGNLVAALRSQQSLQNTQPAELNNDAAIRPRPDRMALNQFTDTLSQLEMAVNQYAAYDTSDVLLGDKRMELIQSLVSQLRAIGFIGVIQLDSYVGDFCYVYGEDGSLIPAPADLPVDACDQIGLDPEVATTLSATQSVAFANFLATLQGDETQGIRVELVPHGNSEAVFAYPALSQGTMAGSWNQIAEQNNRVQVRLIPDVAVTPSANYAEASSYPAN